MKPFDGITHTMTGMFQYIQREDDGEMYCKTMCSNGCCDKTWKINEGDTIIAFRPGLYGHLNRLKIIAIEFKFHRTATLTECTLLARDCEKYPLYD
jgi:hypothetical protein